MHFLRHVIENQDGWRIFYIDGKPLRREADVQIMYRLCWYATSYDVNREPNNGRGPVDFKVSKGSSDKSLVEFKLASNSKLRQNLKHQVEIYQAANDTKKSVKAIVCFTEAEWDRVRQILIDLTTYDGTTEQARAAGRRLKNDLSEGVSHIKATASSEIKLSDQPEIVLIDACAARDGRLLE